MRDIISEIKTFNSDRLPDLVQLKYQFMAENKYRFYRGTCHLFYKDLHLADNLPPAPLSWICGDLHLENYGSYKGDNRLVYFDLNDFDEALLAPAILEVARLVTSIFVAFDSLGIEQQKALNMAQLFLKTYSATLSKGKAYYIQPEIAKGIVKDFLTAVSRRKRKLLLGKHTVRKKNALAINKQKPKFLKLKPALKKQLFAHMTEWIRSNSYGPYNYEVIDAVFRIAGTGSVGLKRYAFLLRSLRNESAHLLVEMKEARPSSLLPYVQARQPAWSSDAERIVAIQQRMQNIPPAMLSYTIFKDVPFIIQEMQPTKDSINLKLIKDRYRDIYQVIDDMALLTASSQLRSSGREGAATADELIAFGQNTQWQQIVLDNAISYLETVGKDYNRFLEAYSGGLLTGK